MTEPAAPPAPAAAPAARPRNGIGILALVLVLITVIVPFIAFIVVFISALVEGAEGGDPGYAAVGAFFVTAVGSAFIAPLAILGIILGIVSLFRKGRPKVQGVLAIIFGIVPALMITLLSVAIDNFVPRA